MEKLLKPFKNQAGFTLIELLIAITILAILAVVGIATYNGVQTNARNARRRADVDQIAKSMEVHLNSTTNQNCTAASGSYCPLQASWFSGNVIPTDPSNGGAYTLTGTLPGTTWTYCATLETSPASTYCRSNQQ